MRGYDISRRSGEWWCCKVTDSYGREFINWFETREECNESVLYIWDTEIDRLEREKLQNEAIRKIVEGVKRNGKLY